MLPTQGAQVQSLVKELRSHMPWGLAPKCNIYFLKNSEQQHIANPPVAISVPIQIFIENIYGNRTAESGGFKFWFWCVLPFCMPSEHHDYIDGVEMDWKLQGWVSESDLLSWTLWCSLEEWWSVWAIQETKSKACDSQLNLLFSH